MYFTSRLSKSANVSLLDIGTDDLTAIDEVSAIYVYCNENRTNYYIGQTNKFSRRHKEHLEEKKRRKSNEIVDYQQTFGGGSIIIFYGNEISSNLNYIEQKLIKIFLEMKIIAGFELLTDFTLHNQTKGNKSDAIQNKREKNDKKIILKLLKFLQTKDFISFEEHIKLSSLDSCLYRNSPFFDLNKVQEGILNDIIQDEYECIKKVSESETATYIIRGGAGTGKTVLMNHLIAQLMHINTQREKYNLKKLRIAVCLKANMRISINEIFNNYSYFKDSEITISDWKNIVDSENNYDFIIVDEAHRLLKPHKNNFPINHKKYLQEQNKDVLELMIKKAKKLVLFYDYGQSIRPNDIRYIGPKDEYTYSFKGNISDSKLDIQYRIKVESNAKLYSNDYIKIMKDILMIEPMSKKITSKIFQKTDYFALVENMGDLKNYILDKKEKFPYRNSRIIAGYSRKLPSKNKDSSEITNKVWHEINMDWNKSHETWATAIDKKTGEYKFQNDVGVVHSVQGFDLDYVGVIIGKDLVFRNGLVQIDKSNYSDSNGKKNVTSDDELLEYIKNIYYVLLTRGIYGIRVYIEDEELRKYFSQEIKKYYNELEE